MKFYKLFAKILRWSLENLKNQLTSGEFLSHPVEKIIFKHFSIFRPNFHQLFAKIMRWSFRNLEKQLTSGKNQLTSGQKSADIRFRFNHLLRFISFYPRNQSIIEEIQELEPFYKHYRWRRCHSRWKTADIRFRCRHLPRIYPRNQSTIEEIQELQPFDKVSKRSTAQYPLPVEHFRFLWPFL